MKLRRINQPAVLELMTPDRVRHYAVLGALEGEAASLALGRHNLQTTTREVDPFWLGDFILLWRPPPLAHSLLKRGMRGPDVLWLRGCLDRLKMPGRGEQESVDPDLFDAALAQRVRRFQRENGLLVDGVVGKWTLFELLRVTGKGEGPALSCPGSSQPRPGAARTEG